jgi:hypothetical protein
MFEVMVGSAGMVVAYISRGYHLRGWKRSLGMAETLLKDSWPLIFSRIAIMIYLRIDQVMLGEMAGADVVRGGIFQSRNDVCYFDMGKLIYLSGNCSKRFFYGDELDQDIHGTAFPWCHS